VRLAPISCSCIDEATPTRNFAVLYREQVYEVGPKLLFRIMRIPFYVAQHHLGAFLSLASLPMAAVLLAAMFTVYLPYGFSSIKIKAVTAAGAQFGPPGYEVDLLYLACLAALVLSGPGPFTISDLIGKLKKLGFPGTSRKAGGTI
jgi:hypothetical protein